jgi:hypothetical protein
MPPAAVGFYKRSLAAARAVAALTPSCAPIRRHGTPWARRAATWAGFTCLAGLPSRLNTQLAPTLINTHPAELHKVILC